MLLLIDYHKLPPGLTDNVFPWGYLTIFGTVAIQLTGHETILCTLELHSMYKKNNDHQVVSLAPKSSSELYHHCPENL